jgi:hypothetical protein
MQDSYELYIACSFNCDVSFTYLHDLPRICREFSTYFVASRISWIDSVADLMHGLHPVETIRNPEKLGETR